MLVGLHGPAQSGKDTVFGMLRAMSFDGPLSPYIVRRDAFADRLKISAARALGYKGTNEEAIAEMNKLKTDGEVASIIGTKHKHITGREYLQYFGTEAHREVFDTDFWVKAVLPDGYPSEPERLKTVLVITDVRFPNEAERVHECGGVVWRIVRPSERIAESAHTSETPLDDEQIDWYLHNDGTLDQLRTRIEEAWYKSVQLVEGAIWQ